MLKLQTTAPRRETFANSPAGRIRRDARRKAINGKRAFAYMGAV